MNTTINVHDFKTHYSKHLARVIAGEEILLGKHGKPFAKIVPLPTPENSRKPGALKGKVWVSEDFDKPMQELWNSSGEVHR